MRILILTEHFCSRLSVLWNEYRRVTLNRGMWTRQAAAGGFYDFAACFIAAVDHV